MNYSELKVIAVEDDQSSREVLMVLLKKFMNVSDVIILEDSTTFPAVIETYGGVPDLVFLDIHVYPYDGYTMLKMIQEQAGWAATKVVALTASVMASEVHELREAGFHSLISKPINPDTFIQYVDQMLGGERVWIVSWD